MTAKLLDLMEDLKSLLKEPDLNLHRDKIAELLEKVRKENEMLSFKFERSNKEKNILSSLLTRTSADLKEVTRNLKIRAEELSILLKTIPTSVYFKDTSLRYILVNKAFESLVELSSEQIIGKRVQEVIPNYRSDSYVQKELSVLRTGTPMYDIEEEYHQHNRTFYAKTNLAPIRNVDNTIIGLIGISWDVTDWKHHEEELTKAKEQAEAGTQSKNEFIASVSHELRTPMNGILGLSEILRNTPLNQEQIDLLKGITSSAENLLILLNDVLDFSAIEAGKMEIDLQPFNLKSVLDDISLITKIKVEEKSLKFSITIAPEVPFHLVGDAQRLRQIILNLTNNAVKFTDKGSVHVKVTSTILPDGKVMLRFDVEDTGMGIPEKSIKSLFQVFSRIKQQRSTLIAGTGLGLSICKKLTDMLGGEIGVSSQEGKGSTFWFTLPFEVNQELSKEIIRSIIPVEQQFNKKSVLVAEDNAINQRIIEFQLKKMGFEVTLVSDGREAIKRYCSHHYDLIILDIQMPIMDGYQTAKKIREIEQEAHLQTPIIALTANAMKGDRELYLSAGMDDYISKPFTQEALQNAISNLLKVV